MDRYFCLMRISDFCIEFLILPPAGSHIRQTESFRQPQTALFRPSMGILFCRAFTSRGTMIRSRIRVGTI